MQASIICYATSIKKKKKLFQSESLKLQAPK